MNNIEITLDTVWEKLQQWVDTGIEMLPNIVLAIVCMILSIFLGKLVQRGFKNSMRRMGKSATVSSFVGRIIFIVFIIIGLTLALSVLNLSKTVSSILAGVGIIGLALGFAFQDTAANFIAGIYIAINRPYAIDDIIETKTGHDGRVLEITLRVTRVETFDGPIVYIPNRMLFEDYFINLTEAGKRRVQVKVGVSYSADLEKIEKIVFDAIDNVPLKLEGEDTTLFWTGFDAYAITFTVNVWLKYTPGQRDFVDGRNQVIKAVKSAFDKEGITIPFPIRTLDFGIEGGSALRNELKNGSTKSNDE
jgi:small conductance mechanosensitive channel